MAQIHKSTVLAAPIDRVWDHLNRPELLQYLWRGWLTFNPVDPPEFPEYWEEREYTVALRGFGRIPLGWQIIGIERPYAEGDKRILRDRGRSFLFKTWTHTLTVEPARDHRTRYTDDVSFDAGLLTPLLLRLMRAFFARRHRRWKRLVERDFDYR